MLKLWFAAELLYFEVTVKFLIQQLIGQEGPWRGHVAHVSAPGGLSDS